MKKFHKKSLALLFSIAVLLTFAVGSTVAYLVDASGPVVNEFKPASVTPSITEGLNGKVKENVRIQNTGSVSAYIRAKIIITWQDESGNVYPALPVENTDYTITIGSDWTLSNGYYYYKSAVESGAYTSNLIGTCEVIGTPPTGYTLHVEILAQAIQADGLGASSAQEAFAAAAVTPTPAPAN